MSDQTPKALLYCRVSSKTQEDEGHGLASQETRCREYAAAKGYAIEAVFPDTITGGGDFMKRPGMVALLSYLDAQPGEPFVVIFDDLKRFARDREFHFALRDAFRARNASVECLNFRFDETPEGEFIETIMAAQGMLERKQNSRQVAQKMKARMQNGYWIHNAPIGYRYKTIKGQGKVLIHDEPLASIIRQAFEGYASGRFGSQAEIKRWLETCPDFPRNSQGIITQQKVTEIITNPLYTGHICSKTYDLDWLKGHHEPLITLETFDKVQSHRDGAAKTPMRKNIGEDFVLRGFVTCGDCGTPLRSSWSTGRSKRYPYYLCQSKTCESYGKSVARDRVEAEVGALIRTVEPAPNVITLVKRLARKAWDMRLDQAEQAVRSAKRQILDVEKQTEALLARIMEATNDKVIATYETKIADLEHRRARLEEQALLRQVPTATFEEKLEPALKLLANPWKLWETGHTTLRRAVLKMVFTEPLAYHRNEGARTATLSLPFKVLGGKKTFNIESGAGGGTRTRTA